MEPSITMAWIEFLTGRFFFLIAGAFGLIAYLGTLYYMNRTIGIDFKKDVMALLKTDVRAASFYFGARLVAVALFLGMLALAGASVSIKY